MQNNPGAASWCTPDREGGYKLAVISQESAQQSFSESDGHQRELHANAARCRIFCIQWTMWLFVSAPGEKRNTNAGGWHIHLGAPFMATPFIGRHDVIRGRWTLLCFNAEYVRPGFPSSGLCSLV